MRPLALALLFALLCSAACGSVCIAANGRDAEIPREPSTEERRDEIDRLLFERRPNLDPKSRAGNARLALVHLRALLARAPGDANLHWLSATAWSAIGEEFGSSAPPSEAVKNAMTEFEKARRLAPDGALDESVASNLGILASKLGDFDHALIEYDRAIALRAAERFGGSDDEGGATLYGNSAETLMALGRLDEAIGRYRAAVELSAGSMKDRALGLFGEAVAFDRDEQFEKSRAAIGQALALEQQLGLPELGLLDDEGVFFMPRGEKLYYAALGHLALGHDSAGAASLRRFLDELPGSRYAASARVHLAEVEGAAREGRSKRFRLSFGAIWSPPRDPEAVGRMLQRSEGRLAGCFAKADFLDGGARGDLRVVVRENGQVAEVLELVGPITLDRRCVSEVARAWRFGAGPSGPVTVPIELGTK